MFRGEEGGSRHPLRTQIDRLVEALLAGALHGDLPVFVVAVVRFVLHVEGCVGGVVWWVEVPLQLDPGGPKLVCFFKGFESVGGGYVPDPIDLDGWF